MDYLSGKQIGQSASEKPEKTSKRSKKDESIFSAFCNTAISCLNPDEQADICERFLKPEIISVMKDQELIECINAFFKNNLNISETSRNAFLHRNTLLYRIEKIYKITGLNIRNFEEAMSFRLLTIVYDKMRERIGRK
ncbi:MAG: helix-turn-helix domain-containing protein [Clostridia bacterium]|nr:helix-turn-helix domain-containing protein [Clostridia bacterium]